MALLRAVDPNFGSFQTDDNPLSPQSSTNWQGGPALGYGIDPAFQSWSNAQPGQWPYYLEGYGGGTGTPAAASFPFAQ
jgi:hypothetical protein